MSARNPSKDIFLGYARKGKSFFKGTRVKNKRKRHRERNKRKGKNKPSTNSSLCEKGKRVKSLVFLSLRAQQSSRKRQIPPIFLEVWEGEPSWWQKPQTPKTLSGKRSLLIGHSSCTCRCQTSPRIHRQSLSRASETQSHGEAVAPAKRATFAPRA